MALDPVLLMTLDIPRRQLSYGDRDTLLYALSLGAGTYRDSRYYYEDGQRVIPSFGQNLAFDDSWIEQAGIDMSNVMHGGLDLHFHAPFAPAGEVEVATRIAGLSDKGPGKAAIVLTETTVSTGGLAIFTSLSSAFVVGGGGFGGDVGQQPAGLPRPDGPATATTSVPTRPDQALFFRLLGDRNLLHVLAGPAQALGFEGPILHGACTLGIACLEVLDRFCDGDPARMTRFATRFSGPVYPGETLEFEFWKQGETLLFSATTAERGQPVLGAGVAELC